MADLEGRTCGNCGYMGRDARQQGECRRYPPTAAAAPLMGPRIAGAMPTIEWVVQPVRPPVRPATPACGEWQPRPEDVN